MTAPAGGTLVAGAATYVALDAAYRAAIARVSLAVARAMLADWESVSADNLAGTSSRWLNRSVQLALAGQRDAAQLADRYTTQVRRLSVPDAPSFTPPPREPPNEEQIRNSIIYTGLAQPARQIARAESVYRADVLRDDIEREEREAAKRTLDSVKQKIMETAIANAAGTATRHVVAAGHDQIKQTVEKDAVALGFYRTTKGGCCYYCAMLASRGPVYKEDSFKASNAKFTGSGEQKVHDHCGCGLRPFYTDDDPLPERTEEFSQLWGDSTEGASGDEAIIRFRRKYEGRSAPRGGH